MLRLGKLCLPMALFVTIVTIHLTNAAIKLDHGGIRILSWNKDGGPTYLKVMNMTNSKGERSFGAEFTVKQLPARNIVLSIKPYFDRKGKLVPAPIKLASNVCDAFDKNYLKIRTVFDNSNLTSCPMKPGTYRIYNYIPNDDEIPALPVGRYQADLMFLVDNLEWATIRWNGGIVKK